MIGILTNKRVRGQKLTMILFLVLCGFMLVACQSALFTYKGARISQANLIPLTEGGLKGAFVETEDVTVDYEYTRTGDNLRLGGEISYSRALQNSFSRVPDFYLRVFFADAQGTVLALLLINRLDAMCEAACFRIEVEDRQGPSQPFTAPGLDHLQCLFRKNIVQSCGDERPFGSGRSDHFRGSLF